MPQLQVDLVPARPFQKLLNAVRREILAGQQAVRRRQAQTYWNVGKLIATNLLENKARAGYGEQVFKRLAEGLQVNFTTLHQAVKFYEQYPKVYPGTQLPWSHYRALITVDDPAQRIRLEQTARRKNLNKRQLQTLIKTQARPPAVSSPPPKLKPLKGTRHTYQVEGVEDDAVLIDCGFSITRRLPRGGKSKFAPGVIVRCAPRGRGYALTIWETTARELYTYRAQVKKIIDADTFWVKIDVGFDTFVHQKIRLRGVDAPEIKTALGRKAKVFVEAAFKDVDFILVRTSTSDKYDRYLADVFYGKEETFLNQELLDQQLAVVWKG